MFPDPGALTPGREFPALCESGPPGKIEEASKKGRGQKIPHFVSKSMSGPDLREVVGDSGNVENEKGQLCGILHMAWSLHFGPQPRPDEDGCGCSWILDTAVAFRVELKILLGSLGMGEEPQGLGAEAPKRKWGEASNTRRSHMIRMTPTDWQ